MSTTSPAQHRFMEMVAHDPAAANRVGVPQSVGQDFVAADAAKAKGKRLAIAMKKGQPRVG